MRAEFEPAQHAPAFPAGLFAARPADLLRRAGGRETFRWEEGFPAPVIVKRMPGRGGRREHDNLEALRAAGLPVPRPIAWAQEGRRPLFRGPVRSLVVMEEIPHDETLRDRLAAALAPERERWASELLELVLRLHGQGWHHRDLYLQHVLVRPAERRPRLVLIDVGRARLDPRARRRWYVKDVAALLHSCPQNVGTRERLRFLAAYLDRRGIAPRPARRSFARAVVRKAAAMARHVPRDERPGA
jgi:tRNA A-37 threonylcarbamoyl transferase component Bud32